MMCGKPKSVRFSPFIKRLLRSNLDDLDRTDPNIFGMIGKSRSGYHNILDDPRAFATRIY